MGRGNIIGKPNNPTSGTARGIWSMQEQYVAKRSSIWPISVIPDQYVETQNYASPAGGAFSTYTFSNMNLTGGSTKIVCVTYVTSGTPGFISTASIAGQSATVYNVTNASAWQQVSILVAPNVSSQSGSVVLNFNTSINTYGSTYYVRIIASVYTTTRNTSYAFTQSAATGTSVTLSATANANNNVSCFVIAGATTDTGAGITGTGLTFDYDQTQLYHTTASSRFISANRMNSTSSFAISTSAAVTYGSLGCLTIT